MTALENAKRHIQEHGLDRCIDPSCEGCMAERAYESQRAREVEELDKALRDLREALFSPFVALLGWINRLRAR